MEYMQSFPYSLFDIFKQKSCNLLTNNAILLPFQIKNVQKICKEIYYLNQSFISNDVVKVCYITFEINLLAMPGGPTRGLSRAHRGSKL